MVTGYSIDNMLSVVIVIYIYNSVYDTHGNTHIDIIMFMVME